MVAKVNGTALPGIWVERRVSFVKITFSQNIGALPAANMFLEGTTTAVTGSGVGNSAFGVVDSAIVSILKLIQGKATVLGVSRLPANGLTVDVMLGFAEGFFAASTAGDIIAATAFTAGQAKAVITTAGSNAPLGTIVDVATNVTWKLDVAAWDGEMPIGTGTNGEIVLVPDGNGAGTAAAPMGAAGWYPARAS